jgi:hypothetical protein
MGVFTGDGQLMDKYFPRLVPNRHDSAFRIRIVVQVLAYVFQACGGFPETGGKRQRLAKQPAGPGRQTGYFWQRPQTAPTLLIN